MKKRKKNKFVNKSYEESASTATLAGAGVFGAYQFIPDDLFENVRGAVKLTRHAGKTVADAAQGGPEGMRAAKNLEEAIIMVESAAETNGQAKEALESYLGERKDLNEALLNTYQENETMGRVASRLQIQLEGVVKNTFDAGNSIKPDFMKKVDNAIIKLYGKNPEEAREQSGRLKEFYDRVEDFYDTREKNEHTVKEFCEYLAEVKDASVEQNKKFNELFPNILSSVKEGYETEDTLFDAGERNIIGLRNNVSPSELENIGNRVENYTENVDETETSILQQAPIEPYKEPSFAEYSINPVTIGIAAGLAVKGATKILPGFVEKPLRKVLAAPVGAPYEAAKGAVKKSYQGIKKMLNKKEHLSEEKNDR